MLNFQYKNQFQDATSFIAEHYKKLVVLALCFGMFFMYKLVFIIVVFFILDFIVSYVDQKYKVDLMFDFNPLGLIVFSYALSYNYGFIFVALLLVPRIIIAKLQRRHLIKLPILIVLALLANFLNALPIQILGSMLFVLRYVLEYTLDFAMTGTVDMSRVPRRVIHLLAAIFFFAYFGDALVGILRA